MGDAAEYSLPPDSEVPEGFYNSVDKSTLLHPPQCSQLPPAKYSIYADIPETQGEEEEWSLEQGQEKYEGAEHMLIGEAIFLPMVQGDPVSAATCNLASVPIKRKIIFNDSVDLRFGKIISLAGDFYSTYNDGVAAPICGAVFHPSDTLEAKQQRFESAVKSLLEDSDRHLYSLSELIDKEKNKIVNMSPNEVAQAYHSPKKHDLPGNFQFEAATLNSKQSKTGLYGWIAYINADHFGNDAVTAYTVGHGLALGFGKEAARQASKIEQLRLLKKAYIYDAFACHYLTDLFSSGHNRVPRRQFHNSSWKKMMVAGVFDVPVWDKLSQMCHDDDNATGLLVSNRRGDQWIAFGDKQFLLPHNRLNRARAVHCVQESVNEIYEKAFKKEENVKVEDYVALQLLPLPMLSLVGAEWMRDWGGSNQHNPAPLWEAQKDADSEVQEWTCREVYNDHSNFLRVEASAEWHGSKKGSKKFEEMKAAAFCGNDQFPDILSIEPTTGGFIQVQQLRDGNGDWQCINFWGPVEVNGLKSFNIRNRLMDIHRRSDFKDGQPIHWMKWFNGSNTIIMRIDVKPRAPSTTGSLRATSWILESNQSDKSKQIVEFDPISFCKFTATKVFDLAPLMKVWNGSWAESMYTRYIMGSFTTGSGTVNPDIAGISFHSGNIARISILSTSPSAAEPSIHTDEEYDVGFVPWGFLKTFKHDAEKSEILIANGKRSDDNYKLDFNCFSAVGDVLSQGNDQVVAILSSREASPTYRFFVYGAIARQQQLQTLGEHKCFFKADMRLVRHYLTALIPVETDTPQEEQPKTPGLHVLNISLQQDGSHNFHLVITTHKRMLNSPNGSEQHVWGDCVESVIRDTMYERYAAGIYFLMKFLRCSYNGSSNAIMEVFSWYGVQGVRIFAISGHTGRYELVGQQPYMGQTSIGMGMGCTGDWGYGIMTWGPNEDFVDENVWIPSGNGDATNGSWGLNDGDMERRPIRGWEVWDRHIS